MATLSRNDNSDQMGSNMILKVMTFSSREEGLDLDMNEDIILEKNQEKELPSGACAVILVEAIL